MIFMYEGADFGSFSPIFSHHPINDKGLDEINVATQ
jgi:hypothetical protein